MTAVYNNSNKTRSKQESVCVCAYVIFINLLAREISGRGGVHGGGGGRVGEGVVMAMDVLLTCCFRLSWFTAGERRSHVSEEIYLRVGS